MHRIKRRLSSLVLMAGLILGCHGDRVALLDQSGTPVRIFPYRITLFPAEDREALREGIRIENEHHLQQLLADFLS